MKKFLIIGNVNAVTYKEIFPLIKNNEMWLGPSITSGNRRFDVPESYPLETAGCGIDKDGIRFIRVKGVRWFTNLEHNKRHEPLVLYKKYLNKSEGEYPKYDNYDAIEVSKTCDIPMDYDGVMGVPITALKYLGNNGTILADIDGKTVQFEIVDAREYALNDRQKNKSTYLIKDADGAINGKPTYARICIRKTVQFEIVGIMAGTKGDTFINGNVSAERYVYTKLQGIELSPEAREVLDNAIMLIKKSFRFREMFNDEHPEYQILNWDCGWYQIKGMLKEYMPNEYKEFTNVYKKLADKMRPMVYELGFLK